MKKILSSLIEAVGGTPLVRLNALKNSFGLKGNILAKIESFNPASSVKDRAALFMIEGAEKQGLLKEGGTIIEPTSGNTGIGLAWIAAIKGYRMILTMPSTMSIERRKLASQFGAEIVLTEGSMGMKGAIAKAVELAKQIPNSFMPNQFDNDANAEAHRKTTATELLEQTGGDIDYFVSAVGSGGTLTGVGEVLKQKIDKVKVVAIEPQESPVLSGGQPSAHGIQGIGAGFKPSILKSEVIDEIITITTAEAIETSKLLAKKEGILAGISSGAALAAAIKIAQRNDADNKNIVVVLPDTGERYLSTKLFD